MVYISQTERSLLEPTIGGQDVPGHMTIHNDVRGLLIVCVLISLSCLPPAYSQDSTKRRGHLEANHVHVYLLLI